MSGTPRLDYQPALDGVRALAVAVVLLFHAGVPGFGAGYLGVSVFFTLSGFLITGLLLAEHDATGRIDLAEFYSRRLRRLLPASLLTIAVVAVLSATTDLFAGVTSMRSHVMGSVLQVVNWLFLAEEGSYQERLAGAAGAVSPLEHFWSLAIEEQFYWVWPVSALGLFAVARSVRSRTIAVGSITVVAAIAAPVIATVWGGDAAYWATPARLSEILIGALLAVVLAGRGQRAVDQRWQAAAMAALVVLAVLVARFPASDEVAEAGVLPLVGVVSGLLLFGLQSDGPATRLLSLPPLVWLGRISYGVYLYHWPIFVIVDEVRLGRGGVALFAARVGLTLAVAALSFVALEQPIRRFRGSIAVPTFAASALATAGVVAIAFVVVPSADSDYWQVDADTAAAAAIEVDDTPLAASEPPAGDVDDAAESTAPPTQATVEPAVTEPSVVTTDPPTSVAAATTVSPTTSAPTTTTIPPIPALSRPMRVLVTGDSTAEALGAGVVRWAAANPDLAQAEVVGAPGCGLLLGGERKDGDGVLSMATCDRWIPDFLYPAIERTQPDVVVVMVTSWDIIDRRWDDGALLHPTDPEFRRRLDESYSGFVADAVELGASRIAFVQPPIPNPFWLDRDDPVDGAARHGSLADAYAFSEGLAPDIVEIVPMAGWFGTAGYDDDQELRPDGVHLSPEAAERVTDEWLGEQVLRIALDLPR